ncbi:MAG TPA: DUF4383 domain-containing protein [Solirubrobacterales bacterium]|nr:DUF4383 domain-containing protein [Solirubrobacterales bacterium]
MEAPSPARLYAAAAGALLFCCGLLGFFYDASFSALDDLQPAYGVLEVNAWINLLYIVTGALGILLAGVASRRCSLAIGLLYTLLGIFALGATGFHLVIGLLGLAAVAGTPSLKPRAKPARERA